MMASQNDMHMAENTYKGFISFAKWGTIVALFLGAVVVLLIS